MVALVEVQKGRWLVFLFRESSAVRIYFLAKHLQMYLVCSQGKPTREGNNSSFPDYRLNRIYFVNLKINQKRYKVYK